MCVCGVCVHGCVCECVCESVCVCVCACMCVLLQKLQLVKECVMKNNISTPFKYDCLGRTWKAFMKRNKFLLKKASMICISRKSNTANSFVIYDFYDKLATKLMPILI